MSSLKAKKSFRTDERADAIPESVPRTPEVVIGRVVAVDRSGAPLVDFPDNPAGGPVQAVATSIFEAEAVGRDVALMFARGDLAQPLAIGLVKRDAPEGIEPEPETVTITARKEITLRCGRASIVLTRAGKVLIRGAYVSHHSTGMQRITGASVQIN